MADGPLHPGCGGAELPGHFGVEDLGDGVDHVHVLHGHDDGLPEVLVPFDVGGHADLVDDGGDVGLQGLPGGSGAGGTLLPLRPMLGGQQPDPLHHRGDAAGFHHVVVPAPGGHLVGHAAPGKAGQDQRAHGPGFHRLQHVKAVHPLQDQVHDQNVRVAVLHQLDGLLAVPGLAHHFQALLGLDGLCQDGAELLAGVGNENGFLRFHADLSPPIGKAV